MGVSGARVEKETELLFEREFAEIYVVFWCSDEIDKLAHLCLVRGL